MEEEEDEEEGGRDVKGKRKERDNPLIEHRVMARRWRGKRVTKLHIFPPMFAIRHCHAPTYAINQTST